MMWCTEIISGRRLNFGRPDGRDGRQRGPANVHKLLERSLLLILLPHRFGDNRASVAALDARSSALNEGGSASRIDARLEAEHNSSAHGGDARGGTNR